MRNFPNRIMIFGRPGSGKSTFSLELQKITHLPLHHLDKHFYERQWIERDYLDFLTIQKSLVELPSWIIDGNSIKSLEIRWKKADLVLYLSLPRHICYIRVFKRLLDKNPHIDDRAPDCREKISFRLLRYMWSYEKRVESQILALQEKYPHTSFIKITSRGDFLSFQNNLSVQWIRATSKAQRY